MLKLIAFILSFGATMPLWADTLLPYIQINLNKAQVVSFSSQGLSIKDCAECRPFTITPTVDISYWNQNQEVTLKQATELYVQGQYDLIAIYYDRKTQQYDKLVFNGYNELDSLHYLPKTGGRNE